MLETNIRIVRPGPELHLWVRRAAVQGPDLSVDLLQRACGTVRHRNKLAAVPYGGPQPSLLVATNAPIPVIYLEQENWVLEVRDAGGPSRRLSLTDPDGASLIPPLIERTFLTELARRTDLWTLDTPRIWYEAKPFRTQERIAAYRRFEVASLLVEGVGIGIVADVGTAFFTTDTLAYFFDPTVAAAEQQHRRILFAEFTGRQKGQKGTLLYDSGRSKVKCYFVDAPDGVTCGSTGKFRVKNKTYDSLFAYYRVENPELPVAEDTSAVRVSFPFLDRPQWVAADRVYARVMNDDLPESLSAIDKIAPRDRRVLLQGFWNRLEPNPLGGVAERFYDGFWRPDASRITRLIPPGVEFGQGKRLPAPALPSLDAYRDYYRRRLKCLEGAGCFSLPPTVGRTLYCAYPRAVGEEVGRRLAADIVSRISKWARRPFDAGLVAYDRIDEAIDRLRRADRPGTALFVLDQEPAAYYEVSFQLNGWRVKRITEAVLREHYHYLIDGAWDRKRRAVTAERGQALWDQFVTMNALDVFQQMDGIPWRSDQGGPYEALLVIDVGHDRRHFALSLLIARSTDKNPSFGIYSVVEVKPDHKQEMINPVMLADYIVRVFEKASRRKFDPIGSMLILRDGRLCGREPEGIDQGMAKLIAQEMLGEKARVDAVSFHKESLKSVRLWELEDSGDITNPLEGTALRLNEQMAVVAFTGAATLHQGTAEPFVLEADSHCSAILDAACAAFSAVQLNWSSPMVAQRLPLPFKRTDEELTARAAQELRRIR
jgi:hypothetical protein